jgi:hypothetical protein
MDQPWAAAHARAGELNSRLPDDARYALPAIRNVYSANASRPGVDRQVHNAAIAKLGAVLDSDPRRQAVVRKAQAQAMIDRGVHPGMANMIASMQNRQSEGGVPAEMYAIDHEAAQAMGQHQLAQQMFAHQQQMDQRNAAREDATAKFKQSPLGVAMGALVQNPEIGAAGFHDLLNGLTAAPDNGQTAQAGGAPMGGMMNVPGQWRNPATYSDPLDKMFALAHFESHSGQRTASVDKALEHVYANTNLAWGRPDSMSLNTTSLRKKFIDAAEAKGIAPSIAESWWTEKYGRPWW